MLKLLMKKLGTPPIEPDKEGGNAGVSVPGASASAWAGTAPERFVRPAEPDRNCAAPVDFVVLLGDEAVSPLVGCERCRTASGAGDGAVVVCVVVTVSDGAPGSAGAVVSGAAGP